MPEFITMGETMAVMAPCERVHLRYCSDYKLRMAGAESNTAIGLSKLGHSTGWISRLVMTKWVHTFLILFVQRG